MASSDRSPSKDNTREAIWDTMKRKAGGGAERYMEKITGVVPSQDGSDVAIRHYQALASGLAAVWSKDNAREAIWDAMKRKEVYATTATRMTVRVFAG